MKVLKLESYTISHFKFLSSKDDRTVVIKKIKLDQGSAAMNCSKCFSYGEVLLGNLVSYFNVKNSKVT